MPTLPACPTNRDATPGAYRREATLTEVLTESARLLRESADLRQRIAEVDEKVAVMLPDFSVKPKAPRHPYRRGACTN